MLQNSDHRTMSSTDQQEMNATPSSFDIFPHVKAYGLPAKLCQLTYKTSIHQQKCKVKFSLNSQNQSVVSIIHIEILLRTVV